MSSSLDNISSPLDNTVLEAAATWYVDLLTAPAAYPLHQMHQAWLAQAPAHRQAWNRVVKLQAHLSMAQSPLARTTLSAARLSRRHAIKAFSVLLIGGVGLTLLPQSEQLRTLASDHRTGTGETRQITLADGGRLQMNTATAVDIHYGEREREIVLRRGEVLITTAVDAAQRPFFVRTTEGKVRALGTRFSVFSDGGYSRVRVFEQAVEVQPADGAAQTLVIQAGQTHAFTRMEHRATEILEPYTDTWTQGLLVASDWRLDRFVDELGRYRRGVLSVDEQAAALRISGAFNLNDIPAVLENLSATLPVKIRHRTRFWTRIEAR